MEGVDDLEAFVLVALDPERHREADQADQVHEGDAVADLAAATHRARVHRWAFRDWRGGPDRTLIANATE